MLNFYIITFIHEKKIVMHNNLNSRREKKKKQQHSDLMRFEPRSPACEASILWRPLAEQGEILWWNRDEDIWRSL